MATRNAEPEEAVPPTVRYKTRVVKNKAGTYDGQCACQFTSSQWPTKKLAEARIGEHREEHETEVPMRELHDFRIAHGLVVDSAGVVGFADDEAKAAAADEGEGDD